MVEELHLARRVVEYLATRNGKALLRQHGLRRNWGLTRLVERREVKNIAQIAEARGRQTTLAAEQLVTIELHERGLPGIRGRVGYLSITPGDLHYYVDNPEHGKKLDAFTKRLAEVLRIRAVTPHYIKPAPPGHGRDGW